MTSNRIFKTSLNLALLLLILFAPASYSVTAPRSLIKQFGSPVQPQTQLPTRTKLVDYGFWRNMVDWLDFVVSSGSNQLREYVSATNNLPFVVATSIVRVQGNARGTWSSGATFTVTLSTAPTAGNLLVASIGQYSSTGGTTVSSITQTGVSWSKAQSSASVNTDSEIWVGTVSSGASQTVTINLSAALSSAEAGAVADICEYSGVTSTIDQTASNGDQGASSGTTGTTGTTSQGNELLIGSIFVGGSSSASQSSPTNSFTLLDGAAFTAGAWSESLSYLEETVGATGTYSTGTSWGGPDTYSGVIATLIGMTGPPPSDFTITPTTPSQTVGAGATATYTLTVTYSSTLKATVSLTVTSGCPTGETCTLTPSSVTGSSTVTLSVPTLITTPGGTTSITVTASSTSPALTHSVSVQLTVSSPGSYGVNVHAAATRVVVTVSWTGSGAASVTLAGPGGSPTLSESAAVVYDRVTYASGSSSPTNIHRVTFAITAPTSAQTWTVLVSLSGSYTITIEVS